MNEVQELERARQAADVLANPAYLAAIEQMKAEVYAQWQSEKDERQREWLWSMSQAVARLDSVLTDTMATGQLVSEALRRKESMLARGARILRG